MSGRPVRVDQTLHGYSRGHRELAASTPLDDGSRGIMLGMSDMLADVELPTGSSYLTAYPLKPAARHVLARTWSAGRGYRPGSVWTHSLVLDYGALALIPDLAILLALLRRPTGDEADSYDAPLIVDADGHAGVRPMRDPRVADALSSTYSVSPRRILELPRLDQERDETLAVCLWRQMWPGLRRDFAFLTVPGEGVPDFDAACVLRFVDRAGGQAEPEATDAEAAGTTALIDDIGLPGPTPLRSFLGRYVIEASSPRSLVMSLASLQRDESPLDAKLRRIEQITALEPLPRLVRDTVARLMDDVSDARDLAAVVRTFRDREVTIDRSRLIDLAGRLGGDDLADLLEAAQPGPEGSLGAEVMDVLVVALPLEIVADAARSLDRVNLAGRRPELVTSRSFWPRGDRERADLVAALGEVDPAEALATLGRTAGPITVGALLDRAENPGAGTLSSLLEAEEAAVRRAAGAWLVGASGRLRLLDGPGLRLSETASEALTRAHVDANRAVADPETWIRLLSSAYGDRQPSAVAPIIVGYVAALHGAGENALALASRIYGPLQDAIRSHRLTDAEGAYLARSIPHRDRSWSLRRSLTLSAVGRWPPSEDQAGALAMGTTTEQMSDLVDAVSERLGPTGLERASRNPGLPEPTRKRITKLLERPSNKLITPLKWFFGEF